jgi:hypothetical protein
MCLQDYTVALLPSRIAEPTIGLPTGVFEIESYQKISNGTYGEGLFYLCGYDGDLKPLLDQHLEVKDNDGTVCYCGYVAEVYRCCGEYVAWGWSNATLYNRIAVTWAEGGVPQITPWQSNRASMQTYGVRELVVSLPSSSLYTPAEYAQRLLKELSEPRPILHNTYKCRCNVTYLRTQGYYATLAWQSYHNQCGLADTGASFAHAQKLGIGFTSDQLAINGSTNGESQIGEIGAHPYRAGLLAFEPGSLLLMSGWSNPQNNIVTTVTDFIKDDFESVTSDGISTAPPNHINDSNSSLTEFHPDELIQVSGSGSGDLDGYYWVRTEDDGSSISVQHESFPGVDYSGIPITITHGVTINVPSNLAQEDPGAWVTIKGWDQYLCQRICNECDKQWTATHIQIAVRRHGSPTADISLRVKAGCGAATHLAWASIGNSALGTTIGTSFAYHTAELSTPITLAPGQCVYVEVHVVNALGVNDYYEFGGSLAQTTAMRALTGPDGASWTATNYTTAMQLIERKSITDQLADLVALGDVVTSVTVRDHLTYTAPTYRSGYTSLLYAIEQLLIMGDPEGNRLQLMLDCDGNAVIRTEPTVDGEPCTALDCCSCAAGALCTQTAGRWLCPSSPDLVDVPGVFLEEMIVSYKACRARYIDRDFSRTLFNQALRFPGVI